LTSNADKAPIAKQLIPFAAPEIFNIDAPMESGSALKIIVALAKPLGVASLKKLKKLKPIEQFRIEQSIESAFAEVWESLDPFFKSEHVGENQREIVASTCGSELHPFVNDVSLLLRGSLDGEKLFEQIRFASPFPQAIRDENLEQVYRMVFPLVASVVCRAPVIIEQIEEKSLGEVLSRFDQLKEQVSNVSSGIAQLRHEPQKRADELYGRVLQQALKKVLLGVEVTGLYGDSPLKQAKEEMFVLPSIEEERAQYEIVSEKGDAQTASVADDHRRQFLTKSKRSIIRGTPGAGKSTWGRWLQAHALRNCGMLTVAVKLRSWQDGTLPTVTQLVEWLVGPNMATEISADAITKWVKGGNIAVILDGFDEVAPVNRDSMLKSIDDLADYIDGGPCIVTSRPLHSDHLTRLGPLWTPWTIQPFDVPRIIDYISRWYRHAPLKEGAARDIDAPALHAQLIKDPHVAPLTSNPLMLATLLMVHHNDGELPKGRSRLYARYIDGMLGIWDDRQEVNADLSGLDREQKKRVLTSLAIALHIGNTDELGETETLKLIDSALKSYGYRAEAQQVLDSLRERSGLIIGPGSYSFSHKSVGEYLVAQAIYDGDRVTDGQKLDRFLLHSERSNDRWLNVIYFWAGQASVADVQSFIEALNNKEDLGLWIGLLWDQMDRFQQDWLNLQVRSALSLAEDPDALTELFSFQWICWLFEQRPPIPIEKEWVGLNIPIRHVAEATLGSGELAPLFRQIGISFDCLPEYKTISSFNLAFSAALTLVRGTEEEVRAIRDTPRWPDWLKKSQLSLKLYRRAQRLSLDEAIQLWNRCFPNGDDTAEVWIAAAWLNSAGDQFMRSRRSSDEELRVLTSILSRPWSDHCLALSASYHPLNISTRDHNGPKDLLKMLVKSLDRIAEGDDPEGAKLARACIIQVAELGRRRQNLNK
jgi:hypothetical protein